MKTLSRPFTLVIVLAIAVVGALIARVYADSRTSWKDWTYSMKIKQARKYKDPIKTDTDFKELLQKNDAVFCIKVRKTDNGPEEPLEGSDCSGALTASSSVDNATRELVLICGGARVTQRAGFNTAQQLLNVENALATPTPTPSTSASP